MKLGQAVFQRSVSYVVQSGTYKELYSSRRDILDMLEYSLLII